MQEKTATPAEQRPDEQSEPIVSAVDPKAAGRFHRLLGKERSQAWLRFLHPSRKGAASDHHGLRGASDLQLIEQRQRDGFNVYVVIGNASAASGKGGGVCDDDITSCPAVFVEWDDGASIDEQSNRPAALGLPEPTVTVATGGKSLHCYWALQKPLTPAEWRVLQRQLIGRCNSDRSCCNPSRVMRLPGSIYIDKKTGKPSGQCRIIGGCGARYDAQAIAQCLPAPAAPKPPAAPPRGQLQPRGIDEINTAAAWIPRRSGGEGTYSSDRNALCGCSAALAEAGHPDPDGAALALLAHKWPSERDAAQVLASTTTRNAASFWAIAREHGYQLQRSGRYGRG